MIIHFFTIRKKHRCVYHAQDDEQMVIGESFFQKMEIKWMIVSALVSAPEPVHNKVSVLKSNTIEHLIFCTYATVCS